MYCAIVAFSLICACYMRFLPFFSLAMTRPNAPAESTSSLLLPQIANDVSSPSDDEVEAEGDDSDFDANRDRVNLASAALSDSRCRWRTCESRFLLRRDSLWYFSYRLFLILLRLVSRSLPAYRLNISSVELPEPNLSLLEGITSSFFFFPSFLYILLSFLSSPSQAFPFHSPSTRRATGAGEREGQRQASNTGRRKAGTEMSRNREQRGHGSRSGR
jgi:hypothetical protein